MVSDTLFLFCGYVERSSDSNLTPFFFLPAGLPAVRIGVVGESPASPRTDKVQEEPVTSSASGSSGQT